MMTQEVTKVIIDGKPVFHEMPEKPKNRIGETIRIVRRWGKLVAATGAAAVTPVIMLAVADRTPQPPASANSVIEYAPTSTTLPQSEKEWVASYHKVGVSVKERLKPDATERLPFFMGTVKVYTGSQEPYNVLRPIILTDQDLYGKENPNAIFDFQPLAIVSNDADPEFDLGVYFMDDPFHYEYFDLEGRPVAQADVMKHVISIGGAKQVPNPKTAAYDIMVSGDMVIARGDSGFGNV